ncbi:S-adenosylmethionine synthetase [Perkinsela sp. CCAP 1560/4]|nr:S-adenosylmethionine synthetase [Perkinsela sp. CCAP 1560/4]|eukprot:KNH09597.1 S-adenosylmethionine synthetase [Perkinsela sp. CCAP 1560/4]
MSQTFLFSSEHVTEGHPDKMCDQVSDAVLDACLEADPNAKVACETATKTGMIMTLGEITTKAHLDFQRIVRDTVKDIGFNDSAMGFDYKTCNVLTAIEQQSAEIGNATQYELEQSLGAGDQGLMFGYATNETEAYMPLSYELARGLAKKISDCRRAGVLPWARPDAKTQVTVEYEITPKDGNKRATLVPKGVKVVLISVQHTADVSIEKIREDLMTHVIHCIIPDHLLHPDTVYHINPSGSFVVGGPQSDAGLTGRKIIVDTYGGWGAHGGGAFSGKDPTKVDRSACYAARWIAKSLCVAGLASRCLVQLAYAIGVAEPLSIYVDSYGTGVVSDTDLLAIVKHNFQLRPYDIIQQLNLRRPIYFMTARFGHFGRTDETGNGGFTWEIPKKLIIPKDVEPKL